jgi:hypothetical protein
MHIISTGVWAFIGAITVIVFILIVINRAQYTDLLRNKHYWSKKRFEGEYAKIPSICPTPAPTAPTATASTATAPIATASTK